MSEYWPVIAIAVVAVYMCWRYPTGVGGDPFPCEQRPSQSPQVSHDDPKRCAVCGWTLADEAMNGCVRGNCSLRPLPGRFYSPARAKAEYAPYLDNDKRCVPVRPEQEIDKLVRSLVRVFEINGHSYSVSERYRECRAIIYEAYRLGVFDAGAGRQ